MKSFIPPYNCTALAQQMIFRQGVYYNPFNLSLYSPLLYSLRSLARRQCISSALISWPKMKILTWKLWDMIIGSFQIIWGVEPYLVYPCFTQFPSLTEQPKCYAQSPIRAILIIIILFMLMEVAVSNVRGLEAFIKGGGQKIFSSNKIGGKKISQRRGYNPGVITNYHRGCE